MKPKVRYAWGGMRSWRVHRPTNVEMLTIWIGDVLEPTLFARMACGNTMVASLGSVPPPDHVLCPRCFKP
jgi:hypothetical protein